MSFAEVSALLERVFNVTLFEINKQPITVSNLIMFVLVISVFAIISRIVRKIVRSQIFPRVAIEEGTQYTLLRVTHYLVIIVGAVVAFQFIGIDLTGLAVIFGLLSVGIGFGLQNVTSNFVAGLILLFERPIKVGDRITVGNTEGDVAEINIRSTTIRSLNNIAIIVPNSEFVSSTVINWTYGDQRVRLEIDVGVSYHSDLEKVFRCLREVAEEHVEVLRDPKPEVLHTGFGDSSWNIRLRAWISNPKTHPQVRSALNCAIVRKFRENGIEIPFPQRDLHVRSPLPVLFAAAGETSS
jgi:small-conductance mechanosensitive channel